MRCKVLVLCLALLSMGNQPSTAAEELTTGTVTGLPLPRFVSLKPSDTPMRQGPGKDHAITWVFKREGLPVEVTAEYFNWRRVRDAEGTEGWIYHSRLSGRRTAMINGRDKQTEPLFDRASLDGGVVARLESGVVAQVESCDGRWCQIHGDGFDGHMMQDRLWGVYVGEAYSD
jgi:SH3-like domain-containing protein